MPRPSMPLTLQLPLHPKMLGVATHFAEQASLALGLAKTESLSLTLCAEEVFSFLTGQPTQDDFVLLQARAGAGAVELQLEVSLDSLPLSVFNRANSQQGESAPELDHLGLIVASRLVDHFHLDRKDDNRAVLTFRKEKKYPAVEDRTPPKVFALEDYKVVSPPAELGKMLSRLLVNQYSPYQYPPAFAAPGRLADMLAQGDYQAVCAMDHMDHLGGCVLWRQMNSRTVDVFGPYIFDQPHGKAMAEALFEDCLNRTARQETTGLLVRYATPELPREYCEFLGDLEYRDKDGAALSLPFFYRQLNEDQGAGVWAHPLLESFLKAQYERLFLPRNLLLSSQEGEKRPNDSVIGFRVSRDTGWAFLHVMLDGGDFADNLRRNLDELSRAGFLNLGFTMDLGLAASPSQTPALFAQGFAPRLVIPSGGRSDLLVWQRTPDWQS